MKYEELYADISRLERELAPGGETTLWGIFADRMRELGINPQHPEGTHIATREAAYWIRAYELFALNESAPEEDRYTLQEILDRA